LGVTELDRVVADDSDCREVDAPNETLAIPGPGDTGDVDAEDAADDEDAEAEALFSGEGCSSSSSSLSFVLPVGWGALASFSWSSITNESWPASGGPPSIDDIITVIFSDSPGSRPALDKFMEA
jgi:hypothetical protein